MIIELACAWCICTTLQSKIIECSACNRGTQKEATEKIAKHSMFAGQVAMLECKQPEERFQIDWAAKGLGDGK